MVQSNQPTEISKKVIFCSSKQKFLKFFYVFVLDQPSPQQPARQIYIYSHSKAEISKKVITSYHKTEVSKNFLFAHNEIEISKRFIYSVQTEIAKLQFFKRKKLLRPFERAGALPKEKFLIIA